MTKSNNFEKLLLAYEHLRKTKIDEFDKREEERLKSAEKIISTLEKLKDIEDKFPKNEHNNLTIALIRLQLILKLDPLSHLEYFEKQSL